MAYREETLEFDSVEQIPHDSGFDLDTTLEEIAHWLPTQGPIKDFVHHNTLHAVQHLPFHDGVAVAAKLYGARSYLPLRDYQQMYQRGRIKDFAIDWALEHTGCPLATKQKLRQRLFEENHHSHYPPMSLANHGIRNAWLSELEIDLNALVQPILFRLLSHFLDQGISRWNLPKDGETFWQCVLRLAQNSLLPLYPLNEPGIRELLSGDPEQTLKICLDKVVDDEQLYHQYLLEMLLSHPGWAGMVRIIEQNPAAMR